MGAKQRNVDVPSELCRHLTNNFLSNAVTGDEIWCFQYDPQSKRQILPWKQPTSPGPKEVRMSKLQMKLLLITFFYIKVIGHFEFIPQGQTFNIPYSVEILKWLREALCRKGSELLPNRAVIAQSVYRWATGWTIWVLGFDSRR
jgi:hypothetical protein